MQALPTLIKDKEPLGIGCHKTPPPKRKGKGLMGIRQEGCRLK